MQRNESLAASDVVEQGLFLLGFDLRRIGDDHEACVLAERLGIQVRHLVGIRQLDASLFEYRLELLEAVCRPVVAGVAEEEELERLGGVNRRVCACGKERRTRDAMIVFMGRRLLRTLLWRISPGYRHEDKRIRFPKRLSGE